MKISKKISKIFSENISLYQHFQKAYNIILSQKYVVKIYRWVNIEVNSFVDF